MAKQSTESSKSESGASTSKGQSNALRWANIYLDAAQKEAAKLFTQNPDHFSGLIATLLSEGYTLSLAFNEETDSTICTIIGKRCGAPNEGWGMSTHAGSWELAMARALYKHFILGEELSYAEMAAVFENPRP